MQLLGVAGHGWNGLSIIIIAIMDYLVMCGQYHVQPPLPFASEYNCNVNNNDWEWPCIVVIKFWNSCEYSYKLAWQIFEEKLNLCASLTTIFLSNMQNPGAKVITNCQNLQHLGGCTPGQTPAFMFRTPFLNFLDPSLTDKLSVSPDFL